jgi:replicative DNA helicase
MKLTLTEALRDVLKKTHETDKELFIAIKQLLTDFEAGNYPLKESTGIEDLFKETMQMVSDPNRKDRIMKSGYGGLDEITAGFFPGEFVVFGGRPAMGKTQLLVNIVLHASKTHPVLYFSFDLSPLILTARFASALSSVPVQQILTGKLTLDQEQMVNVAGEELENRKIFINETGYNAVLLMKEQIVKHCRDKGVKLVVIDYLQMMGGGKYRHNRDLEISSICRELKNTAKEENISIIVTSQLNRGTEYRGGTKRPMLSDLRDSGAIEEDADKVIFLYRPEYYHLTEDEHGISTKGIMHLVVAKNRNGSLGETRLISDADFTSFSDFDERTKELIISRERLDDLDVPF